MDKGSVIKQQNQINSIAPYEKSIIEKMRLDLQEIMIAKFEPKINTYSHNELTAYCQTIVEELMIDTQSNSIGNQIMVSVFTSNLISELSNYKHYFTLSEARNALKLGFRGEFGEIIGLNAVNFSKCLKGYKNWPKRLEAGKEYHKVLDQPRTTDKPVNKIFYTQKNVDDSFNHYKEFKRVNHWDWTLYDWMKEQNYFNWSEDEKIEMKAEAQKRYKKYLDESVKKKAIDKKLLGEIMKLSMSENITLSAFAKVVALEKYFERKLSNKQTDT